jgi:hypothetical protein
MSADEAPEPGVLSVANLRDTEWYEGNDDKSCDSDSWSVISFESLGARCTKTTTASDESQIMQLGQWRVDENEGEPRLVFEYTPCNCAERDDEDAEWRHCADGPLRCISWTADTFFALWSFKRRIRGSKPTKPART